MSVVDAKNEKFGVRGQSRPSDPSVEKGSNRLITVRSREPANPSKACQKGTRRGLIGERRKAM